MDSTRREFLGHLGGLALAALPVEHPDLVLHNGHIITVDAANPAAQAVAITRGRFVAVGADADVRPLATRNTRVVNLGGHTVVPGFIDAHNHPASAGLQHLRNVSCNLPSIAAIQAALRQRAAATPAGEWVLGFLYDDTKTSEGRFLTRQDLDTAAPAHPVLVEHRGGHTPTSTRRPSRAPMSPRTLPIPRGGGSIAIRRRNASPGASSRTRQASSGAPSRRGSRPPTTARA